MTKLSSRNFDSLRGTSPLDTGADHRGTYSHSFLKANGHGTPLEDHLLVDEQNGIFILVDGVTRTNYGESYPDPSPAERAAKRFVEFAHKSLISNQNADARSPERILEAMAQGNMAIAQLNQELFNRAIDYLGNDLAGVVGLIAALAEERLILGYLGDVCAYGIHNGSVRLLTDLQTRRVAELRQGPQGFSDQMTVYIRRDIRNNRQHEMGFGTFTGEHSALHFLQFHELWLKEYERVLLASDGILELARAEPEALLNPDLCELAMQAQQYNQTLGKKIDDVGLISLNCTDYLHLIGRP